ncbi:MAG: rhodanese [Pirellulaceae bacterium]|nr:rhodanese [Pirellulaceae bacterium]
MNLPVNVEVEAVKELLDDDKIVLIDCREPNEWELARIEGAVLLPLSQWEQQAGQLAQYADKHIVVHCHHGGRSLRVTNWLRQNGFSNTQNMAGGIDAWSKQIDESVPRY